MISLEQNSLSSRNGTSHYCSGPRGTIICPRCNGATVDCQTCGRYNTVLHTARWYPAREPLHTNTRRSMGTVAIVQSPLCLMEWHGTAEELCIAHQNTAIIRALSKGSCASRVDGAIGQIGHVCSDTVYVKGERYRPCVYSQTNRRNTSIYMQGLRWKRCRTPNLHLLRFDGVGK